MRAAVRQPGPETAYLDKAKPLDGLRAAGHGQTARKQDREPERNRQPGTSH